MVTITKKQIEEYITLSGVQPTFARIMDLIRAKQLTNEIFSNPETGYVLLFTDLDSVWPHLPNYRVSLNLREKGLQIELLGLVEARNEKPAKLMMALTGQDLLNFRKMAKLREKAKKMPEI